MNYIWKNKVIRYSLDTLTDGSEYYTTGRNHGGGGGGGTVCLTVSRVSASGVGNEDSNKVILARYCLTGAGPMMCRLASDQGYKLSYIRAVLLQNSISSMDGLPSLLLSLSNYSQNVNGDLKVIGPMGIDDTIEKIASLTLGRHRSHSLNIQSCPIPDSKKYSDDDNSDDDCWWKVYQDDFIVIHGRSYVSTANKKQNKTNNHHSDIKENVIVYIITLLLHQRKSEDTEDNNRNYSFAILPPPPPPYNENEVGVNDSSLTEYQMEMLHPLPEFLMSNQTSSCKSSQQQLYGKNETPLSFILHLNPATYEIKKECKEKYSIPIHSQIIKFKMTNHHLATIPNNHSSHGSWDDGILIRATHQNQVLHTFLPFVFPIRDYCNVYHCNDSTQATPSPPLQIENKIENGNTVLLPCKALRSCTSVDLLLNTEYNHQQNSTNSVNQYLFRIDESRKEGIWERCKNHFPKNSHDPNEKSFPFLANNTASISQQNQQHNSTDVFTIQEELRNDSQFLQDIKTIQNLYNGDSISFPLLSPTINSSLSESFKRNHDNQGRILEQKDENEIDIDDDSSFDHSKEETNNHFYDLENMTKDENEIELDDNGECDNNQEGISVMKQTSNDGNIIDAQRNHHKFVTKGNEINLDGNNEEPKLTIQDDVDKRTIIYPVEKRKFDCIFPDACTSSFGIENTKRIKNKNSSMELKGTNGNDYHLEQQLQQNIQQKLDVNKAHLLVLGTGCASPSPLRNSSSFALLLPTTTKTISSSSKVTDIHNRLSCVALIECGEGCLTQLARHLPATATPNVHQDPLKETLQQIRWIWISHAHLDHYGELPLLIKSIVNAGGRVNSCHCNYYQCDPHDSSKRICTCVLPPVVIAPSKVLRFLDISLNCKNGFLTNNVFSLNCTANTDGKEDDYDSSCELQNSRSFPNSQHQSQNTNFCGPCSERSLFDAQKCYYFGISHKEFNSRSSILGTKYRNLIYSTGLYYQPIIARSNNSNDRNMNKSFTNTINNINDKSYQPMFHYCPFQMMSSIAVEHCPDAYGLFLLMNIAEITESAKKSSIVASKYHDSHQHQNHHYHIEKTPFTLCFSGDTRPSRNLVKRCHQLLNKINKKNGSYNNSSSITLLIHESTFGDDLREEAIKKKHTSFSEALNVAHQLNAEYCLLSHFSQRYPCIPPGNFNFIENKKILRENKDNKQNSIVGMAYDGMILPLTKSALSSLYLLNSAIVQLLGLT